ncbi:hypothetical protein MFRU_007g01860 [Monilinia fructicola]|uniref:C2H2-type domain-containing protein n=1 Tax=Monilinia fructicola TaxID=38448 RepID=A0A5M9JE81_MONFR|nr:hypothetical protein EYC84_010142 [Monilinia fructicola]KAG4032275.1 hypothetical protein MFRU_007g01860 [Monilinia fructicola]
MSPLQRPSMKGRDSSGREVSLLNATQPTETSPSPVLQSLSQPQLPQLSFRDISYDSYGAQRYPRTYSPESPHMVRTNSNMSTTSNISIPSLFRSDSYDSHGTNEAQSPITPTFTPNAHGRNHSFPMQYGKDYTYFERNSMEEFRPTSSLPSITQKAIQSISMQQYPEEHFYHEESYHGVTERLPGKRYPCRFKDSHQCSKTFTTSGHASRHAKIHTAEKMVRCTFAGCMKKFTRADNMKQHLDTHFKDKPRSSSSNTLNANGRLNGKSPLTMPARVQKKASPSISARSPRPKTPSRMLSSEIPPFDLREESQNRYNPYVLSSQALSSATPTNFQNLPTRSKGPINSLDLLAEAALN